MLTEIDLFRALARHAPRAASRLPAALDQIDLIDLGQRIRMLARTLTPVTVRGPDVIHFGTALPSKVWATDPDGVAWEYYTVLERLVARRSVRAGDRGLGGGRRTASVGPEVLQLHMPAAAAPGA